MEQSDRAELTSFAVATALDRVEGVLDSALGQRRIQQLALVVRHDRVLVAVDDEKRRVVCGDVGDRISSAYEIRVILNRPTDQQRLR